MIEQEGAEPPAFDALLYAEQAPPRPGGPADTNSPSQRAAAEKRANQVAERRVEVLRAMLSTTAGREFLAYVLFDLCGLVKSTILGAGHTAMFSEFRSGQRDVGLNLHKMLLRADKSGYVVLLTEHVDQM